MALTRKGIIPSLPALTLLVLLVASANLVGSCVANPYSYRGQVPPDQETYPPAITIASPINNTAYNISRVLLTFNVTAPQSKTASSTGVDNVAYKADWQNEAIDILQGGQGQPSFNLLLSNIPEGQHSIAIKADGTGIYVNEEELSYKSFFISSTSTISFTIDCTAPTVSVLSLAGKTCNLSDVPLYFTVNEPVSQIAYSLNGKENVTVSGNTTLTGLANGDHNVTVYAMDEAGNIGKSETISFTVAVPEPEPDPEAFPVILVAAVAVASLGALTSGMLFYFKKRKH
ncbi:hypothetical protein G4O51_07725 [Candidatus Bathyarchaeota archaeon A05DMB-2]|jgi:hypothetical protein|nr:hypothetical protein [Candidatus Bathyarchaeota archaeon A05DMB-2]